MSDPNNTPTPDAELNLDDDTPLEPVCPLRKPGEEICEACQ